MAVFHYRMEGVKRSILKVFAPSPDDRKSSVANFVRSLTEGPAYSSQTFDSKQKPTNETKNFLTTFFLLLIVKKNLNKRMLNKSFIKFSIPDYSEILKNSVGNVSPRMAYIIYLQEVIFLVYLFVIAKNFLRKVWAPFIIIDERSKWDMSIRTKGRLSPSLTLFRLKAFLFLYSIGKCYRKICFAKSVYPYEE